MARSTLFRGGGKKRRPDGGFQAHRPYRFLVTAGWTVHRVHCPTCGSVNAGWHENGTPRYSGGHVLVRLDPPYEAAAACRCQDGAALAANGMPFFDEFPAEDVLTPAFYVLWDTNAGPVPDNLPKGPPPEILADYTRRMFEQFGRYLCREITAEQFTANRVALERMLGPRLVPEVRP